MRATFNPLRSRATCGSPADFIGSTDVANHLSYSFSPPTVLTSAAGGTVPFTCGTAAVAWAQRRGDRQLVHADGPSSITRLSDGTGVTRQGITRHLHTLGRANLVRNARRGRERVFALDLSILRQVTRT